jgi:hypothetical protein
MTAGIERFPLGEAVSGKAIMRSKRIKSFCKTSYLAARRIDRHRVVVTVLDAADVLLHTWPKPTSASGITLSGRPWRCCGTRSRHAWRTRLS